MWRHVPSLALMGKAGGNFPFLLPSEKGFKETMQKAWSIHLGPWGSETTGPKQELWRETLWPDGELDDLGIEFVGQDGWDKEWPKWKRADLELPPRDLAQAALVWALGTNRARLCLVDFKGARAKETQSSHWKRQCLPLTSERKGWPWPSAMREAVLLKPWILLCPALGGSRAS